MGCYQCGSEEGNEVRLCKRCAQERIAARKQMKHELAGKTSEVSKSRVEGEVATPQYTSGAKRAALMTLFISAITITALGLLLLKPFSSASTPTTTNVRGPVEALLLQRAKCTGTPVAEELEITSIGPYEEQAGGYPVYARFSIRCDSGNSTTHWSGSGQSVACAWVHRTALGGYSAFIPQIFKNFEEQIENDADSLTHGIK